MIPVKTAEKQRFIHCDIPWMILFYFDQLSIIKEK